MNVNELKNNNSPKNNMVNQTDTLHHGFRRFWNKIWVYLETLYPQTNKISELLN